jgi:1-acylglycerone phosphate reductase
MARQKYALVTGASSGIGYEVSIALSKRGYKVFGCAPKSAVWEMEPLEEYGVVPYACDITDVESIKQFAQFIKENTEGGRLDILYNNAGIYTSGPACEIPEESLEKVFKVNVFGHIYMTKYMVDYVIATKGSIVFTSSVAGRIQLSWSSAYCASKAAIDQYALVLHGEMKPFGVRVHSIITGGVDTAICDLSQISSLLGSRYDVDGVYDSIRASARMSRDRPYPVKSYAEGVVAKITNKRDVFNIYKGRLAYTLNFLGRFLPLWFSELCIMIYFKQLSVLNKVKKLARKKKSD